jgi:hypothetical protein
VNYTGAILATGVNVYGSMSNGNASVDNTGSNRIVRYTYTGHGATARGPVLVQRMV